MKDDLVMAYKLTPSAPTLLEARNALVAAAWASDVNDFRAFWAAFARRGAGAGAVAPGRFDPNNATAVESFVTGGELALGSPSLGIAPHDFEPDPHLDN